MSTNTVMTVTGPVPWQNLGITDAHTHVWIDAVVGADPSAPKLDDQPNITADLADYFYAGGRTVIDCQPDGCGRDGKRLRRISQRSGVQVVACTGFHLRRYYNPEFWLWEASVEEATQYFITELTEGLTEVDSNTPVRAGFIKIATEATLKATPMHLFEAAAEASKQTNAAIEVHTEKGAEAENIAAFFEKQGLDLQKLIICHIDKRPDFALHSELAQQGITVEYDTFFRPKYQPEENVWPLLKQMVAHDLEKQVTLATDMADPMMWARLGNSDGPGPVAFISELMHQLRQVGFTKDTIKYLTGENIAQRLARPNK